MKSFTDSRLPGARLLWFAGLLLDPQEVEHFIEPAIADLQHEWSQDRKRRIALWSTARWSANARVLMMVALLSGRARLRSTARTRWLVLVPVLLSVFCGTLSMKFASVSPTVITLQWVWLAFGLLSAWTIATSPRRLLEAAATTLGYASVAALGATAFFGASIESASRWLTLGPLKVQTSILVLPMLVLAISVLCARGSSFKAFVVAGLAELSLIAQPDGATALAVAFATIATAWGARTVGLYRIFGAAVVLMSGALCALARDPVLPPVPHVENILHLAQTAGMPLKIAALVALALVPAYPLARAFRIHHKDACARAAAYGIAIASLVSIALPAFGSYPVPLLGYGGSSVVACLVGLAFVLALEPETPRKVAG